MLKSWVGNSIIKNKDAKKMSRNQRYEENKSAEKLSRKQYYESLLLKIKAYVWMLISVIFTAILEDMAKWDGGEGGDEDWEQEQELGGGGGEL